MVEWKMERNSEFTQLQKSCVTDAAQSRLNYLVYISKTVMSLQKLYEHVPCRQLVSASGYM